MQNIGTVPIPLLSYWYPGSTHTGVVCTYNIHTYIHHTCMYVYTHVHVHVETLGLSMELNDDILVQTTSLQTIARVKRVKCFMLHKVP